MQTPFAYLCFSVPFPFIRVPAVDFVGARAVSGAGSLETWNSHSTLETHVSLEF